MDRLDAFEDNSIIVLREQLNKHTIIFELFGLCSYVLCMYMYSLTKFIYPFTMYLLLGMLAACPGPPLVLSHSLVLYTAAPQMCTVHNDKRFGYCNGPK